MHNPLRKAKKFDIAKEMSSFVFYNYKNLSAIQKEAKHCDDLTKQGEVFLNIGFPEKDRLYKRFALARLYFSSTQGVTELLKITWIEQGKDIADLEAKTW